MKPDELDKLMDKVHKIKIKPCPFCGRDPIFSAHENRIFCPHHGTCPAPSTGYYGRWSMLIENWNQRRTKSQAKKNAREKAQERKR